MNQHVFECAGVLFDLDGTLVDSTPIVERIWNDWSRRQGLDPEWVLHQAHGQRTYDSLTLIAPHLTDAERMQAFEEIEGREIVETDGLVVFEGAKRLLDSLPVERWTIVTSGSRALASSRLHAAGLPIPARIVTADDVQNGKPHPEPYLTGAQVLGFAPADCVVLEDAPAGISSAKAAGMRVIAVQTTYPEADLQEADLVISSLQYLSVNVSGNLIRLVTKI